MSKLTIHRVRDRLRDAQFIIPPARSAGVQRWDYPYFEEWMQKATAAAVTQNWELVAGSNHQHGSLGA